MHSAAGGVVPLAKRWVVERIGGGLSKYRQLVKDDEAGIEMTNTVIYAAMTHSIVCRLCR